MAQFNQHPLSPTKSGTHSSQQGNVIHPRLSGDMGMTTAIALDASFNLHSVSRILVAMDQTCWYVKLGLITDVCLWLTSKLPHVLSWQKARQHTSELMSATMIFFPRTRHKCAGCRYFPMKMLMHRQKAPHDNAWGLSQLADLYSFNHKSANQYSPI